MKLENVSPCTSGDKVMMHHMIFGIQLWNLQYITLSETLKE